MPMNRKLYPKDWDSISHAVKSAAGWICSECGKPCRQPGESKVDFCDRLPDNWKSQVKEKWQRFTLTTAHLDHNPSNCDRANLRALCAPCHLAYDSAHHVYSRQLRKETAPTVKELKPIFIPLNRQYFEAFKSGHKRIEYRKVGKQFTLANCLPGRQVTLSLGYGKRSRLSGTILNSGIEHYEHPTGDIADCYGTESIDILAIEILVDRDSLRKEPDATTVKTSSEITRSESISMPTTLTAITLFSGFGLADVGLEQAGFKVVGAVEKSADIAEWHQINHPKCKTMVGSIEEFDYRQFDGIDLLHMSPPCQQHSQARSPNLPRHEGADAGLLALKAIDQTHPRFITLENVRGYLRADSYRQIKQHLWDLGYWLDEEILNSADYGIAQSRVRLIVRWIREDVLSREEVPIAYTTESLFGEKYWSSPFPEKHSTQKGWYSAISDLIPSLPKTKLARWQLRRLPDRIRSHLLIGDQKNMIRADASPSFTVCTSGPPRALLIRREGQRGAGIDIFFPEKPSPTVKVSGYDRQMNAWNGQDREVVKITPQCLGRFQTVPDSFKLPPNETLACTGIGNGVPCELMRQIAASFINEDSTYLSKKKKMITITEAELTANSNNSLTSDDVTAVLSDLEILSPGTESCQTITSIYPLDGEDFDGLKGAVHHPEIENFISLTGVEVLDLPPEQSTALGSENSLADIETRRDRNTAQIQMLEALIADYKNQVKDYREQNKELEEKARAKVLEEFQYLAAQMKVKLQKALSYGVEGEAYEILNSVFPSINNSSAEADPLTTNKESHPIASEESSSSAQDSDNPDFSEQDVHLTMQEIEELSEIPEARSVPKTEPFKWTPDDWSTPNEEKQPIVTLVEQALGGAIGLDPTADKKCLLPAERHFTIADDCLKQIDWVSSSGTVFMNPPYSKPLPFLEKLVEQIDLGHVREAIVLLPVRCTGNQGTGQIISQRATAQCIWNVGRIAFLGEDGTPKGNPDFDCCLIYFGNHPARFIKVFRAYGNVSLLQNSVEPAPLESVPEQSWRRCMVKDAQEGQYLCDYKTFQITYFFEVGDPPGLWKLCIIDKEEKEKFAWYIINTENLMPSPLEFLDDSGTGWDWCFVQVKTRVDHILLHRAELEAAFQASEAERLSRESKKLQQSLPLFQNSKPPKGIEESYPQQSVSPEHPQQVTKELEFANVTQARLWEEWFTQITGKALNQGVEVFRKARSKWVCLEKLTAEELSLIENLPLHENPPENAAEAQKVWAAAESKARSRTEFSGMSDEELERVASEARKELYGPEPDEYAF